MVSLSTSRTSTVASAWDRYALVYQNAAKLPTDVVSYGVYAGTEAQHRLLGPVANKRVLDLGCGGGQNAIALAKQGAIAIGIDISVEQLSFARRLAEEEEARVELRHGELAELAFQRADSVDIVLSMMTLHYVSDIQRAFRQIHRVLKPGCMFLFSVPHPAWVLENGPSTVLALDEHAVVDVHEDKSNVRAHYEKYLQKEPITQAWEHVVFTEYHRAISELFTGLVRSGFRVDQISEVHGKESEGMPSVLIMRGRKEA